MAGRRESLADSRGNLTLSFVEAVDDIDPAFVIWENVPGVLSTRDNAFGCFLAALAGCDSPIVPPRRRKWTNAGVVDGPGRSIAWRILDAQFFGVPQRRRRVFLIARRAGARPHPAEILFEQDGMPRNSPPRHEAEKDAAGTIEASVGGCVHRGGVIGAVSSKWAKGTGGLSGDECQNLVVGAIAAESFTGGASGRPEGAAAGHFIPCVAGTVTGSQGYAGADENDAARGMYIPVVTPPMTKNPYGDNASREGILVATSAGSCSDSPQTLRRWSFASPFVAFGIQEAMINREDENGPQGKGYFPEQTPTVLGNGRPHAVAFHGTQDPDVSGDVTHPVGRNQGQETCIAFTQNQCGDVLTGDVAPALGTSANATGRNTAKVMASGVRRLTPRECERLQGLPDDYTRIPWRGQSTENCPDGPRYKAIGNGMAVPCVRWVLEMIENAAIGGR